MASGQALHNHDMLYLTGWAGARNWGGQEPEVKGAGTGSEENGKKIGSKIGRVREPGVRRAGTRN